mgnify:CR=1 FL=1
MRPLSLFLAAALIGCGDTAADAPAPPPDASLALADTASGPLRAPLQEIEIRSGQSDTLAVASLLGTDAEATFPPAPGVEVESLGDGRVVVRVSDEAPRPVLVPVEVGGVGYVLLGRDVPAIRSSLSLRVEGLDPADPSLLVFTARATDGSELMLDDEDGTALVDDRVLEENALDIHADRLVLDLDAVGPGRRRLRVIAASPDAISNWAEVEVENGRLVE